MVVGSSPVKKSACVMVLVIISHATMQAPLIGALPITASNASYHVRNTLARAMRRLSPWYSTP